jgi:hypothetical protein
MKMAKKKVVVNKALAAKVLEVVNAGLCYGFGDPEPGKMCVESAVCYAMGESHNDRPSCVDLEVIHAKIALNDESWSSDKARANGLRRVAIAQLGSRDVVKNFDEVFFQNLANKYVPQLVEKGLFTRATYVLDACEHASLKDFLSEFSDIYSLGPKRNRFYRGVAGVIEATLKQLKSPGCKYLYLVK